MTDMIRFDKLDLQDWIKNKAWIEFHVNNQLYYVVRGKIQKSSYGVFYLYNIKRL